MSDPFSTDAKVLRRCIESCPAPVVAAVAKILRETGSFKGLSSEEIDSSLDDQGFSLRDRLTLRKLQHKASPKFVSCGKKYYQELVRSFRKPDSVETQLAGACVDETVNPVLLEGMVQFQESGVRTGVLQYLAITQSLSRGEVSVAQSPFSEYSLYVC